MTLQESDTDALFAIADALNRIATALERLGTNNASTPMGAIELLSLEVKNGFSALSDAVQEGVERIGGDL